jgi:hypothetical protein
MFPIVPHFLSTIKGAKEKDLFGGVPNVSKEFEMGKSK